MDIKDKDLVAKPTEKKPPLQHKDGCDYVLQGKSCWIEAGPLAVYILNTGESVRVEIHETGKEDDPSLDVASAYFDEVSDDEEVD